MRSLRSRLLTTITGVAVLAVSLFAVPLAVAVARLYHDGAIESLEMEATWVASTFSNAAPISLPTDLPRDLTVGVYTTDGRRLLGSGPARSPLIEGAEGGYLTATAPIPSDETPGVVRIATSYDTVAGKTHIAWLIMAGLAILVIGLAVAFARRQSARLAAPLEDLTRSAQALGDGDFTIRAPRSNVREADQAGLALEATARRLGDVLDRERAFSANVSHQLRTQLTGMMLGLEAALARPDAALADAVHTALGRGERLQTVIDDLVRLTRDNRTGLAPLDVPAVIDEVRECWQGPLAAQERRLTVSVPDDLPPVAASTAAVRQILRVLLDNALVHGEGEVTVEAADLANGIAIEVADRGPGVPEGVDVFARRAADGHGIGLALARSLAEAEAGRLVLRRTVPPVFSLLLSPAARNGSPGPVP
ncbi:HAMP domain-containing sensor histidine kinase [Microbispora sp. H13382]|uniref:HAMP domain-containing sensor histidine kinase n=1 Tax=Microbispora sp. H13382 TaxID=2729112 RepID=UPI0015FFBFF1|nr:HAMP domain-containing sensor histidine kinase [Microbispora sp. H13382]